MTIRAQDFICPRCGGDVPNSEHKGEYVGAISRVTRGTGHGVEVCSACGEDEALRQAMGLPLPKVAEWPLNVILRFPQP